MPRKLSTPVATLALLTMLAGCASLIPATNLSTPTPSGKPTVCLGLEVIHPNRGKNPPVGPTTEDISAALDRDHPIERVRNLVGDNSSTLAAIDANNATISSLCGGTNAVPR